MSAIRAFAKRLEAKLYPNKLKTFKLQPNDYFLFPQLNIISHTFSMILISTR